MSFERTSRAWQLGSQIRHVGRMAQIVNVFARHGLWWVMDRPHVRKALSEDQVREAEAIARESSSGVAASTAPENLPTRLRMAFEELGPAFVKLGQVLASRDDVLPANFIEELSKLHKHVAPVSFEQIREALNAELGAKVDLFERIEPRPIAAGSIGQVHEAWLKDGRHVVIKVQRPGIQKPIEVDLSLMESLGAGMERYFPEARRLRPVASINEFRRALLGELDFVREAGNTSRLAENFRLSPEISFPEVCWELTTARVLTLGFMQGWPVGDREELLRHGVDPKLVVERGLKAFMKMVFVDGMFHGDLHPGNVLVLPEGRVGFLDCGVAVQISRTTRENLAGLLMALTQEDYEAVVSYFVELSDPDADFDLDAFRHEVANTLSPFMRLRLGDIPTGTLFRELARISAAHGAPMPRELLLFVKTLLTYEAIGHKLDPEFELFPVAESFAKDIVSEFYSIRAIKRRGVTLMREAQMLARHAPYQLRRLLKGASDGTLSLNIASDDVRDIAHAVDRSFARLVKGQMAGFTLLAASVLTVAGEVTDARRLTLFGGIGFILAALLGGAAILGGGGPTRRK